MLFYAVIACSRLRWISSMAAFISVSVGIFTIPAQITHALSLPESQANILIARTSHEFPKSLDRAGIGDIILRLAGYGSSDFLLNFITTSYYLDRFCTKMRRTLENVRRTA